MVASARKVASWVLGVFRDRSKVVMLQLYKDVRQNLGFSNHPPSPCPGVSEFPKPPPLPGRPCPDFSIFTHFYKIM